MRTSTLRLETGTLPYRSGGQGPLVVLSHAFGPVAWGDLDQLATSCTVVIPDWEASTLGAAARANHSWFEPLARELGFDHAALCAWSMAGPAAIDFATEGPSALSRLVLLDVAGFGDDLPDLSLRDVPGLILMRLTGRPTRGFVRRLFRSWVHRDDLDTRPLEEAMMSFMSRTTARERAGEFDDPNDHGDEQEDEEDDDEDLEAALAEIDVPTLVLTGRHSTVLGPEHAAAAAHRLPHGELVVFEESGHLLQLEEPVLFQETLARFVTGDG